jgi:hypothetical protein
MRTPDQFQDQYSSKYLRGYLSTEDAAAYLGYQPYTLRRARFENLLAGVVPPTYVKQGSRVFYRLEDLTNWLSQFKPQTSTAENRGEQSPRGSQS